jgi:hypothetical protein
MTCGWVELIGKMKISIWQDVYQVARKRQGNHYKCFAAISVPSRGGLSYRTYGLVSRAQFPRRIWEEFM